MLVSTGACPPSACTETSWTRASPVLSAFERPGRRARLAKIHVAAANIYCSKGFSQSQGGCSSVSLIEHPMLMGLDGSLLRLSDCLCGQSVTGGWYGSCSSTSRGNAALLCHVSECTTLNAAAAAAAVEDQSSCASVCGMLDSAQISLEHIRLCVLVTITT